MLKLSKFLGKPAIDIKLLLLGKISLVLCNLFFIIKLLYKNIVFYDGIINITIAFIFFISGILFIILSALVLKNKTRIGLYDKDEKVELKKNGIYKISRNPMYTGFYFLCFASVSFSINIINIILCIIVIIIHHKVVLEEEKYLKNKFAAEWDDYCKQTRRYL